MGRRISLLEQSGKPHWPTTEGISDVSAQTRTFIKTTLKTKVQGGSHCVPSE